MKQNDIIKTIVELQKLGLLSTKKSKKHKRGKKSKKNKKNKKHKKMMSFIDPATGRQVFVADSYTTHHSYPVQKKESSSVSYSTTTSTITAKI